MRALLREDGKKAFTGIQEGDYLCCDPRTCCLSLRRRADRLFINGDDRMFLLLRDPGPDSMEIAKLVASVTGFSYERVVTLSRIIAWRFYQEGPTN